MSFKPSANKLWCKVPESLQETVSTGGIILTGNAAQSNVTSAEVIAIGQDVTEFGVGDKIWFMRNAGQVLEIGEEEGLLIPFTSVLGGEFDAHL